MALLEVKNLTKIFSGKKGEVAAVDHVSFTAEAGEIFGLLGPNGAGKTSTIRLIATTLEPTSGSVLVGGYDINKEPQKVRQRVGVLTTDIGVYQRFSGKENLQYFGHLYGLSGEQLQRRIDELADLLDMGDFIEKRAGKYSTGMKQKLAIARAVIHDPQIIIFDEPTSGLDVLASQTVIAFMHRAKGQGKLVVLSTHQMSDAERLCDRAVILHRGRVITQNSVAGLKEQTKTENLEDAFLALVKDKNLIVSSRETEAILKDKRENAKKAWYKNNMLIRIISLVFIAFGLLLTFVELFGQTVNQIVAYACLGIGVVGSLLSKYALKK